MRFLSRGLILTAALAGLVVTATTPVAAAELSNSEFVIVPTDDVLIDDLYAGAVRVVIDGSLEGDLTAAAGEDVVVNGTVTGTVTAIAPKVVINGEVQGTLRVAASRLEINGAIRGDVVGTAFTSVLGPKSAVGGDVVLWAWNSRSLGSVGGNLTGGFRNLSLAGAVTNDVDVAVNRIRVVDQLTVGGDLGYRSDNVIEGLSMAAIDGAVVDKTPLDPNLRIRALMAVGRFTVVLFLAMFALLAVFGRPELAERAMGMVGHLPVRNWLMGAGIVFAPLILVAIALLLLSLAPAASAFPLLGVLVPLILATVGLSFAVSLVAGAPVAGWLGGVLFKRLDPYGAVVVGSAIIGAVWFLPWVGWLAPITVLPLGLGAWIGAGRR